MIAKPNTSIRAGGETYSPNEVKAILERLAQLGINRDKIIAQITPEEAMILKRLGGSGKINPKTGLLSFDDDGGGEGDGGEGDGGDGGYGGGEYDGGGGYDGYGGGWEGGSGGTYGGGEPAGGGGSGSGGGAGYNGGEPSGGEPAGGDPAGGEPEGGGGTGFGGGAGFGGEPDGGVGYAEEDAANVGGWLSDFIGNYFGGPPISNEAPAGFYKGEDLIVAPSGSSYWGGNSLSNEQFGPNYPGQSTGQFLSNDPFGPNYQGLAPVTDEEFAATQAAANAAAQSAAEREASAQAAIGRSEATSGAPLFENGSFLTAAQQAAIQEENAREEARQAAAEKSLDEFLESQRSDDARLAAIEAGMNRGSAFEPFGPNYPGQSTGQFLSNEPFGPQYDPILAAEIEADLARQSGLSSLGSLVSSLAFDPTSFGYQPASFTPASPGNLFANEINVGPFTQASFVPAGPTYADVPLPPEKPADLPQIEVPLPPSRPEDFLPEEGMSSRGKASLAAGLEREIANSRTGLPIPDDIVNQARGPTNTPVATTPAMNWAAWADRYNANPLNPLYGDPDAYDIIQGVLNAAPPSGMVPPANIPNVSTAPAWTAPPTEVATLPVAEATPFGNPFSSGASGYDSGDRSGGGSDEGGERWVNPTGIVPTSETPILIDEGGLEPPAVPTVPTTPVVAAAPVLPTQLIDWYRYGELYPEFGYYQSNRVPTPYKAHGGYFDADAYFADGGLVSQPQQPVQPVTASAPTMAYTDGQGVVGAAAAPPALSPFDAYGLDVQRASPMAPAPAAAAPSFGGLEVLATRNRNAAPVQSQISQNPNLGYSLGVSPLSQIRG